MDFIKKYQYCETVNFLSLKESQQNGGSTYTAGIKFKLLPLVDHSGKILNFSPDGLINP